MACQVFWRFEQLSNTIDWQVVELKGGTKIASQCVIARISYNSSERS